MMRRLLFAADTLLRGIFHWVLRLLPRNMVVPVLRGPLRGQRWLLSSGVSAYWLGSYEWGKQLALRRVIRPGDVVFDVGAHVGFYSLLTAHLTGPAGRVLAFEPLPRNLQYLHRHLSLNRVRNVTVFEMTVSDHTGTEQFAPGLDTFTGQVNQSGSLTVQATTLDHLISGAHVPVPDVIKMDIEGSELRALHGGRRLLTEARPVLFLATHGSSIHTACCDFLRDLGYEIEPVLPGERVDATAEILARKPK